MSARRCSSAGVGYQRTGCVSYSSAADLPQTGLNAGGLEVIRQLLSQRQKVDLLRLDDDQALATVGDELTQMRRVDDVNVADGRHRRRVLCGLRGEIGRRGHPGQQFLDGQGPLAGLVVRRQGEANHVAGGAEEFFALHAVRPLERDGDRHLPKVAAVLGAHRTASDQLTAEA